MDIIESELLRNGNSKTHKHYVNFYSRLSENASNEKLYFIQKKERTLTFKSSFAHIIIGPLIGCVRYIEYENEGKLSDTHLFRYYFSV